MGNTVVFLSLVVLCSFALNCEARWEQAIDCNTSWPGWEGVKYLFTFGDSYSQTGFNFTGTQPSPANPLGNPAYPGYTSASGPNWVDYITTKYNRSEVLTYSLADGGATVDGDLIKPFRPTVQSLIDQVHKRYLPIYGKKPLFAPWSANDSLFAFWIGINDVGNSYWDGNYSRVDTSFKEYAGLLEEIYDTGARNFVFLNVPPLERAPLTLENTNAQAQPREKAAVNYWNTKVIELSEMFRAKHPAVTALVFSTHEVFNNIIDRPDSYPQTAMLKTTDSYCNGYASTPPSDTIPANGCEYALDEYFWLNNLHPTYPVHDATAAELGKFLAAKPPNAGKSCAADSRGPGTRRYRKMHWRG